MAHKHCKKLYNNFERIIMAHKHYCQGTKCHTYDTQSRIRGTKENKVLRTRLAYGDNESWSYNYKVKTK